jgi:low temperature requirement protein LtrA
MSKERSGHLDNSVMVLGYVIMRLALVFQWLRAAKDDPARRRVCLTYAATISIAQVEWWCRSSFPWRPPAPSCSAASLVVGSEAQLRLRWQQAC